MNRFQIHCMGLCECCKQDFVHSQKGYYNVVKQLNLLPLQDILITFYGPILTYLGYREAVVTVGSD